MRMDINDKIRKKKKYDSISLDDIKSDAVGLLHGNQNWNIHKPSH
jgi:hypothetical protein